MLERNKLASLNPRYQLNPKLNSRKQRNDVSTPEKMLKAIALTMKNCNDFPNKVYHHLIARIMLTCDGTLWKWSLHRQHATCSSM
jgi:hypothetical protein